MRLLPAILVFMLPVAVNAQGTIAQRVACTEDAFKFCSGQIPDVPAITVCMKANYPSLSPKCRAQFDRPSKRTRS